MKLKKKTLLLIAYYCKILQDFSIFKKQECWKIKEEYLTFLYFLCSFAEI